MIFYIFISILDPSGQEDETSTFLHHIPRSLIHTSFKCSWKVFYVGCKKIKHYSWSGSYHHQKCIIYLRHRILLIFSHSG